MENIKLEDLLISSTKGIQVGATGAVCAAFILLAQAITIIGGVEGAVLGGGIIAGGTLGLLVLSIALIVIQQFQMRFAAVQNARATLRIGITVLALGIVLQVCVVLGAPGFVSAVPALSLLVHHLALIAGICLITAGISGIICSHQIKGVLSFLEQMLGGGS
jgi:hypothetical protein